MLCGLCLLLLSLAPSFAEATITSDTNYFSTRDLISCEEDVSEDGKFKYASHGYMFSQHLHTDTMGDRFHLFISVFLKQITVLHFSLRSPPVLRY